MSTADYVAKYPRRRALLDTVDKYWLDEAYRESLVSLISRRRPFLGSACRCHLLLTHSGPPGQLESSLKKHTTLLNRLKGALLVGPSDAIIKEIDGLVLTKYLEEIVAAVVEGASRGRGDPEAAVEVCTVANWQDAGELTNKPDHCASPQAPRTRIPPSPPSPSPRSTGARCPSIKRLE